MVVLKANLQKKCALGWKARYVTLKGDELKYFITEEELDPRRTLLINGQTGVEELGDAGEGFVVTAPGGKPLRLRCPTVKEETEWLHALRKVVQSSQDRAVQKPTRRNTKLWWAETKHGQFCFELDDYYEMKKTIGSGGYGVVISAVDTRNAEARVAIKKVVSAFDDVLVAKRMVREIRLLRQFDHVNVVRVLDMLPPASIDKYHDVYIVMERMDTDLHHVIYSSQPLKEAHTQYFLYQTLCALKYIHSASVIHRDVKPSNILVNTNCELKLCDFGLARCMRTPESDLDPKLTEYVVTRWWRAPEVFLEGDYDGGIDVWSVGCILAEMLQKKPLFMGTNTAQMLRLIVQFTGRPEESDLQFIRNTKARRYILDMPDHPPVPLATKFPDASVDALDLVSKMVVFNPDKRIGVDEALAHPWLSRFHNKEQEEASMAKQPINLTAVESIKMTRPALQRMMFEDVCMFRPECQEILASTPPVTEPPRRGSQLAV